MVGGYLALVDEHELHMVCCHSRPHEYGRLTAPALAEGNGQALAMALTNAASVEEGKLGNTDRSSGEHEIREHIHGHFIVWECERQVARQLLIMGNGRPAAERRK